MQEAVRRPPIITIEQKTRYTSDGIHDTFGVDEFRM